MSPCDDYADDWSAYLDAELPAAREALLHAHLEHCELCSGRVSALRVADLALRNELPLPELSPDLRARLQRRIDADGVRSLDAARARRRRIAPLAGLLAAAAALALYLAVSRETPLAPAGRPEPAIAHSDPEPQPEEPGVLPESPAPPELPKTQLAREAPPETPELPALRMPEPEPEHIALEPPATQLDAASDEELALALELDTIEDLDVIENLDLLEAFLLLEGETG